MSFSILPSRLVLPIPDRDSDTPLLLRDRGGVKGMGYSNHLDCSVGHLWTATRHKKELGVERRPLWRSRLRVEGDGVGTMRTEVKGETKTPRKECKSGGILRCPGHSRVG